MLRPFASLALLCSLAASAGAVRPPGPRPARDVCLTVPLDLALSEDWSINAVYRPTCATNYLALSLGWNNTGELRGLGLGIGAGITRYDARGLQLAGGASIAGAHFVGLQVAGLLAVAGEDGLGLQAAGLGALTGERMRGISLGGLFAAAGQEMRGLQAGGLFAASGGRMWGIQLGGVFSAVGARMTGLQAGGVFSATGKRFRGVQLGGAFAAAGEIQGLQAGGGLVAAGALYGVQLGGAAAVLRRGEGLQVAGGLAWAEDHFEGVQLAVVNIGGVIHGAQIGVLNIADQVHGVQLGVVNVANDVDVPFGAVSWVRNGPRVVEAFSSEAVLAALALRLGNERVYSLVGLGGDPFAATPSWTPIAGVGVRIPVNGLAFHLDALAHHLFFDGFSDRALLAQIRARVDVEILPWLSFLAGPTWNTFVSSDADADGESLPLFFDLVDRDGETLIRQWPGLSLGVSLAL